MRNPTAALAAALFLFLAPATLAQAPLPAPPGSEAEGVEHVGNIPINGSVGANFKTYGEKSYMFVTGTVGSPKTDPGLLTQLNYGGLYVYDVTDAARPVLVSHLPVPHYENEDVSVGGNRLLISGDGTLGGSNLVVVDISNPQLPRIEQVVNMQALDEGHTATCVQECKYAWVAGGSSIAVLALDEKAQFDPAGGTPLDGVAPSVQVQGASSKVEAGELALAKEFGWGTHDVQVDEAGIAWVVGGNGTIGFDVRPEAYGPANLLAPDVFARTGDKALERQTEDGSSLNDFIHHNSWRPDADLMVPRNSGTDPHVRAGEKVLITEEDIWTRSTGVMRGGCKTQGSFQLWRLRNTNSGEATMDFVDDWKTEYNNDLINGLPTQDVVAAEGFCSAHYFDAQEDTDLVAVAWYAQGTRILDTSDPRNIKQVGYFLAPDSTVWASYFAPTDKNVVYVMDHQRGIDVLRLEPDGSVAQRRQVRAPYLQSWRGVGTDATVSAHPTFGWVCRLM